MTAQPEVSVIVPVVDDPAGIRRTVASLHGQTLAPGRFEILVVDNGSADGTVAAARAAAAAGPAEVAVLVEDRMRTSYAARNAGIAAANGALLCFLDADMTAPPDYLETVLTAFETHDLDYAGCAVEVEVARPTPAAVHNRLFGFPVADYLAARQWVPTCCLTVRRRVVEAVGPFAADLPSGGDAEFGRRVAAAGFRQGLVEGVALRHPARESVAALTRKTRRTARGKVRLSARDPDHAGVVRAYRSWSRLRPLDPRWVRRRAAELGLPVSWPRAVGVALVKSWLDLVRLATAAAEQRRLRR